MHEKDRKRNEREADIAKAKRGPDYSRLESDIAKNKAQAGKNLEAHLSKKAQEEKGKREAYQRALARMKRISTPQISRNNDRDKNEGNER